MTENKITKNIVVFYHAECNDGFGGAWAAWKKFGDEADYIPTGHETYLSGGLKGKKVFFIDIIPDKVDEIEIEKITEENKSVVAIDHHKTNEPKMKFFKEYYFDNNHSGAVLAWKYFHPDKPVPKILLFIEDVDIWKWEYPETGNFISAFTLYDFTFEIFDRVSLDAEDPEKLKDYLFKGEIISKYDQKIVKWLIETRIKVRFDGYEVYAINAPDFIGGQVAHHLANLFPPFAFIWRQEKDMIHVSLRSAKGNNFDVSEIAKKYGGGGHKAAAGFSFLVGQPFPWKIVKNE